MKTNGVSTSSPSQAVWRAIVSSIVIGACLALPSLIQAQVSIPAPPGMIAWWPGDGNANDIFGTNNSVLLGGATASGGGKVNLAFQFNGGGGYAQATDSPELSPPAGMTIEFWAAPNVPLEQQCSWISFLGKRDGGCHGWTVQTVDTQGTVFFVARDTAGNYAGATTTETGLLPPCAFTHLAATLDQGSGVMVIYIIGLRKALGYSPGIQIPKVPSPFLIGGANEPPNACFNGAIDEVSLYNRALSSNEVWAIYAAGAAGKCKNPLITGHPQTQIGYWGKNVSFSVSARRALRRCITSGSKMERLWSARRAQSWSLATFRQRIPALTP